MQIERAVRITQFLKRAGWQTAERAPLAGDASARRYERLTSAGGAATAVLMDTSPGDPSIATFLAIGQHLAKTGLSPPAVLFADPAQGLVLLEDLGDDLFARVAAGAPALEAEIYLAAVDVLVHLHRAPLPEWVAPLDASSMAGMVDVTRDWYPGADSARMGQAVAILEGLLDSIASDAPVLVLRDYHAENLLWLNDRSGVARVGLLDFQDAFAGHPAYDLVSLLRDARRDVPASVSARVCRRFIAQSGVSEQGFARAAAILAVQRNLRILGVFCRLARRDAKPGYIDLIPRVWGHLERDLAHPALAGLRACILSTLPPPTPGLLETLRTACRRPLELS